MAVAEVGKWNQARLRVEGPHVEHWLNGAKMCEYELWSEDWTDRVAKSKFKDMPKLGTFKKGFICLQEHSERIEFRDIKIKVLEAEKKKESK